MVGEPYPGDVEDQIGYYPELIHTDNDRCGYCGKPLTSDRVGFELDGIETEFCNMDCLAAVHPFIRGDFDEDL